MTNDPSTELPPIEMLDAASRAAGMLSWEQSSRSWGLVVASVTAHARSLQKLAALKAENAQIRRERTDRQYMIDALVNMLGPKALEVWRIWQKTRVQRLHFSWGPDAAKLTGEQRAEVILEWDEASKNAVPISNIDGPLPSPPIEEGAGE